MAKNLRQKTSTGNAIDAETAERIREACVFLRECIEDLEDAIATAKPLSPADVRLLAEIDRLQRDDAGLAPRRPAARRRVRALGLLERASDLVGHGNVIADIARILKAQEDNRHGGLPDLTSATDRIDAPLQRWREAIEKMCAGHRTAAAAHLLLEERDSFKVQVRRDPHG